MFRLTKEEAEAVRVSRSQTVTLKRGQNIKYLEQPTRHSDEHLCCSGVRQNARGAPGKSPARQETRCAREKAYLRLDLHEAAIVQVLEKIIQILNPPLPPPESPRRRIGFHLS